MISPAPQYRARNSRARCPADGGLACADPGGRDWLVKDAEGFPVISQQPFHAPSQSDVAGTRLVQKCPAFGHGRPFQRRHEKSFFIHRQSSTPAWGRCS